METTTTSGVSYTPSVHLDEFKELRGGGGGGGKRENKLKKELYKLAESELEEEIVKARPPPFDFKTVTKQDFTASGFIPQEKEQVFLTFALKMSSRFYIMLSKKPNEN